MVRSGILKAVDLFDGISEPIFELIFRNPVCFWEILSTL